jgi:hypothetical protein
MVGLGGGQGGVHVHYVLHLPAEAFDAAIERVKSHGVDVFVWDHSGYGKGRGLTAYFHDPCRALHRAVAVGGVGAYARVRTRRVLGHALTTVRTYADARCSRA